MKILRRENPKSEAAICVECDSCGSVLEVKKSDGKMVSDQRDGDAVVIKCPVCKKEMWVAVSLWPRKLKSR